VNEFSRFSLGRQVCLLVYYIASLRDPRGYRNRVALQLGFELPSSAFTETDGDFGVMEGVDQGYWVTRIEETFAFEQVTNLVPTCYLIRLR